MPKLFVLTILTFLCSYPLLFSQFNENNTLIIGEIFGRLNSEDVEKIIKKNYLPNSAAHNISYQIVSVLPTEINIELSYTITNSPQKISYRFFNSEMAIVASIITEEIDFACTESAELAHDVHKSNPAVRVLFQKKPVNFVKMIVYNNRHPICKSVNVRNALSLAINKQYILNNLLNKQASEAFGPVDKESDLYVSEFREQRYNPRSSLKLLADDGWFDKNHNGILTKNNIPLHFTLIYEGGVLPDENLVRMIKLDWNKIGIDVSIRPLRKNEINARLNSRNFDAILINYPFEETVESFEKFFASYGEDNFLNYRNARIDRFLNLAKKASPSTEKSLLQGVVNTIIQDQPASFLFFLWMDWYFVNGMKFENFEDEKGKLLPFKDWKLKQKR